MHIRKGDEWKTEFSTSNGHYKHCVVPYGFSSAPSVFQCLINYVLRNILRRFVITYIDDILVYSQSLETHIHHVCQVLQRLLHHQL